MIKWNLLTTSSVSPHVSVIWTLENHRDAVVVPSFLNKIDFVFSETSKQMQNLYFQGKGISWIMPYSPFNLGNIWKFLKLSGDLPHNQKYKTSGHQFIYLPLCSNSLDYHRNKEADDHLLNVAMNVSVTSPHQETRQQRARHQSVVDLATRACYLAIKHSSGSDCCNCIKYSN